MTYSSRRARAALRRQGSFPDWTPYIGRIFLPIFLGGLAVFVLAYFAGQAWGQDVQHMQLYHDTPEKDAWFRSLKQPGSGFSCCDFQDCRRTEAEWRGEGWTAISRGAGGAWVNVPPDKVLEQPKSLDGDAYLCESPNGRIYCFVPPDIGS